MKSFIIGIFLLSFTTLAFCQQTDPAAYKKTYLQKSKRNKTTATVLLGGGLLLEIAGAVAYKYGNASIILFGAGLLSQVVSIPFFISSGINKRKARRVDLSFGIDNTKWIDDATINLPPSPVISMKIAL